MFTVPSATGSSWLRSSRGNEAGPQGPQGRRHASRPTHEGAESSFGLAAGGGRGVRESGLVMSSGEKLRGQEAVIVLRAVAVSTAKLRRAALVGGGA